jgi:hypothetical protein
MLEIRRYSQPEAEHRIILDKPFDSELRVELLKMNLPKQPPVK